MADISLSVQGLISQSIIDTLKSAIESGNIGGLRVEIVPGTMSEIKDRYSLIHLSYQNINIIFCVLMWKDV